jgi:hypothetical protein
MLGYGAVLILAALSRVAAQDGTSPSDTSDASADKPAAKPPVVADAQQIPDASQSSDTQDTSNAPAPNSPLLPYQGGNPYTPFSPNSTNPQSSQITAPAIYTTGSRDLSQISTNAGLAQAFAPTTESGYLAEQRGGYSHAPIERLKLGPFDLKATLLANVISDDNINAGEVGQGKESDITFGLTPAVLLQYGNHEGQKGAASVVYAPTFQRYYHHSDEDNDNQNVAVNATYPFERLTLDASGTYSEVTGYNTDTDTRTTQTSELASFGGSYDIDDKLSFSSHVQELKTSFSNPSSGGINQGQTLGQGDETSSINSSLGYKVSEKITASLSGNFGIDKPQDSRQETYEQALIGVTYLPTEKITFFAQGGAEFRQNVSNEFNGQSTTGNGSGDETNPIFSGGVGYTPFDSTVLTVNASQSVHSDAAQAGQTEVNTGVGVSATQRFFQRLFLNVSFDYSHQDSGSGNNTTTSNGLSTSQDTLTYRTSLTISPTAWSSVSAYYQYLDNESGDSGVASSSSQNYHDNQFGLSAAVQF